MAAVTQERHVPKDCSYTLDEKVWFVETQVFYRCIQNIKDFADIKVEEQKSSPHEITFFFQEKYKDLNGMSYIICRSFDLIASIIISPLSLSFIQGKHCMKRSIESGGAIPEFFYNVITFNKILPTVASFVIVSLLGFLILALDIFVCPLIIPGILFISLMIGMGIAIVKSLITFIITFIIIAMHNLIIYPLRALLYNLSSLIY